MPVTKYYTVNGRIQGERTGSGGYRRYGTDALGSVTTTYTSTGTVENTYRNAPYGTQVARTGAAADPSFIYNGSWGYRQTGATYPGIYVRRRHLSEATASWTTRDPRTRWASRGRARGEDPYAYAANAATQLVDPSGLMAGWRVNPGPKLAPPGVSFAPPTCQDLAGTSGPYTWPPRVQEVDPCSDVYGILKRGLKCFNESWYGAPGFQEFDEDECARCCRKQMPYGCQVGGAPRGLGWPEACVNACALGTSLSELLRPPEHDEEDPKKVEVVVE